MYICINQYLLIKQKPITMKNLNLRTLIRISPKPIADLFKEGYDSLDADKTFLESVGDLYELYNIVLEAVHTQNPELITEVVVIQKFIMQCPDVMGYEEMDRIPTIIEFKAKYPNLCTLFTVWAYS